MDWIDRFRAVLPRRWFPDRGSAPTLDAALAGLGAAWDALFAQLAYVRAQARLATATGAWLDARAQDYLGGRLPRREAESDAAYSARVRAEILRPRGTHPALIKAVTDETGTPPRIVVPNNPRDTGAWNEPTLAWNTAGAWGTYTMPFQFFVDVTRPLGSTLGNMPGWDTPQLGWDAAGAWASDSQATGPSDADLYAAVAAVLPSGVVAWTQISAP